MVLAHPMSSLLDNMRSCLSAVGVGLVVVYLVDNPGVLFTIVAGILLAGLVITLRKGNDE
jgi:hypothetical protein